jgi:hypothetical protein
MTLVLTQWTSFQKPTHLHSHLLFCNRTDQPKKSKRECKPTHPDNATIQCKLIRTQLRTDRRAACNSGFKKLAVQWLQEVQFSNVTFVVADSLVLRNRQLLKPTKRYQQV